MVGGSIADVSSVSVLVVLVDTEPRSFRFTSFALSGGIGLREETLPSMNSLKATSNGGTSIEPSGSSMGSVYHSGLIVESLGLSLPTSSMYFIPKTAR